MLILGLKHLGCFFTSFLFLGFLLFNEFDAVRKLSGGDDLSVSGFELTIEDVLENIVVEDVWLLHHKGDSGSETMEIDSRDIHSIKENFSMSWIIESHDKINESTFSTT